MNIRGNEPEYDLTAIIVKPLYFGMMVNILLPAALLFICYYVNNNYQFENRLPDLANTLFYVFAFLALAQGGLALWWRSKRYAAPMIRRQETFEADFAHGLLERSKPIFMLIASSAGWGFLYFFLTARFGETAMFVVYSFVLFQFVRPRLSMVEKLLVQQEELVAQGHFRTGGLELR